MDKMRIVEENYKLGIKELQTINTSALLGVSMSKWLIESKHKVIRNSSYDREEATLNNQIMKYPIATLQVQAVTAREIQSHIKMLINKKFSFYKNKEKSIITKLVLVLKRHNYRFVYDNESDEMMHLKLVVFKII